MSCVRKAWADAGYVQCHSIKVMDWDWPPSVNVGGTRVTCVQESPAVPLAIGSEVQRIASLDAAGCDYPEILAHADQAAILARRQLQALLDAERQGVFQ